MDISMLEKAADVSMASDVCDADRRQAEQIFISLKQEITLEAATHIIQHTSNSVVLFYVAQSVGEIVLRQWSLLSPQQVEGAYKMLLEYVATREWEVGTSFVVSEFLRSTAMILKRGVIDKKTGDQEELYQMIRNLLTNSEPSMQAIGCQLISAMAEQFSSSWRNAKFSITWDFHTRAKSEFESNGLRRLLEMSLDTLLILCEQSDILSNEFERRLCEKFLEVAEQSFSWNFSSRMFRRLFQTTQTTNSFRPPNSWKPLLQKDDFFNLFFKLHSKVRRDEHLSITSLSCLVQLAGIAGECMSDEKISDHIVSLYVENFLNIFPEGPLDHETHGFCLIMNRLFLYRPVQSLLRMEENLRSRFFRFLSDYIQHLITKAMTKAIAECDQDDHSSLTCILDAWLILLRGRWREVLSDSSEAFVGVFKGHSMILDPTWSMIVVFMKVIQAPPLGIRPIARDEDDEESDDRELFKDVLNPMGTMGCFCYEQFTETITTVIRGHLLEFNEMANGQRDTSRLSQWQEDMHWVLLYLCHSIVGEELDGSCHMMQEVFDHSQKMIEEKNAKFSVADMEVFLTQCIQEPAMNRSIYSQSIDPFIQITGEILAWSSLEHQLVSNAAPEMISPELARSTLLCLKRFINSSSHFPENLEMTPDSAPILPIVGDFSDLLVKFIVHKVFTILTKYSGETKLCNDAVDLIIGMVESRASTLATTPELFEYLERIDLARISCRTSLMKALVLIGAGTSATEVQESMYLRILEPLGQRFSMLCNQSSSSQLDSELVDLIQCFDGVAKASQPHSAAVLFGFLNPVLTNCTSLMKTRAGVQPVVSAILVLLLDITVKVSIYIDNQEESMALYRNIMEIVNIYCCEQRTRYVSPTKEDDERATDLVVFMDILTNVLSKDMLEGGDERVAAGAQVATTALETLLSVMDESTLQFPDVANKFFRLILFLVDFSPEALTTMSCDFLTLLIQCLKEGATSKFGVEITSTSLEAMSGMITFFTSHREMDTPYIKEQILSSTSLIFETCLENSCEHSIFADAASCLYVLVCYDKESFDRYVMNMLSQKSNEAVSDKLRAAFASLFPGIPTPGRREKVSFRNRMGKFLDETQGLLSCN